MRGEEMTTLLIILFNLMYISVYLPNYWRDKRVTAIQKKMLSDNAYKRLFNAARAVRWRIDYLDKGIAAVPVCHNDDDDDDDDDDDNGVQFGGKKEAANIDNKRCKSIIKLKKK